MYVGNNGAFADDSDSSSSNGMKKRSTQCPGGYGEGEQRDIDNYWYECRNGQVIPKGCLTEGDRRRIEIDATFDTKQFRMQCVKNSDGYLSIVYKSCVHQGVGRDVGAEWDDGVALFGCVREKNSVRLVTLGCVDQGHQMKLDDRTAKGDFVYQCKKSTDGTPQVDKVGCVLNGHKYTIGETYEGDKVWYTCTDKGSKAVGCMFESRRLQSGDLATTGDQRYTCKLNDDSAVFEPYACLQTDEGSPIERKIGCFWVEGRGSEAYEYTCKADSSNKLSKVQTHCVYHSDQGTFKVDPGCVQLASTIAVGCLQDSGSGKLTLGTYSASQIDSLPGLRKC